MSFVGAYERVRLQLEKGGAEDCPMDDSSFYLTTQTPETQSAKSIIATRPKSEAAATKTPDRRARGRFNHLLHGAAPKSK